LEAIQVRNKTLFHSARGWEGGLAPALFSQAQANILEGEMIGKP
jgi:hypothetical protein